MSPSNLSDSQNRTNGEDRKDSRSQRRVLSEQATRRALRSEGRTAGGRERRQAHACVPVYSEEYRGPTDGLVARARACACARGCACLCVFVRVCARTRVGTASVSRRVAVAYARGYSVHLPTYLPEHGDRAAAQPIRNGRQRVLEVPLDEVDLPARPPAVTRGLQSCVCRTCRTPRRPRAFHEAALAARAGKQRCCGRTRRGQR